MSFRFGISFRFNRTLTKIAGLFSLILFATFELSSQIPSKIPPAAQEDHTWWYVALAAAALVLAGIVFWMLKTKRAERLVLAKISKKEKLMSENSGWNKNSQDVKKTSRNLGEKLPKTGEIFNRTEESKNTITIISENVAAQKRQAQTDNEPPIFNFQKLEPAAAFEPLLLSNDEGLLSAIEQSSDEFEEDAEIRELSVRVMARFKTRNSVEALSQVALYDLSANLRSKAVSILVDFDHESVFETILLGCADPTREVRAVATRGFFRLSFDRADAWKRIIETGDEYRMRQAALAASEADLVTRSCDRLIYPDPKIAYDALTLLALMIHAGETEEIFNALLYHKDNRVKLAVAHVIGLTKEERSLSKFHEMLGKSGISMELKNKIDEIMKKLELIPA